MRAFWSAFYTTLHGSLNRLSAEKHFQAMQRDISEFANSVTIPAFLSQQRDASVDPTARYRMIHLLVAAAQSGKVYSPTAHTMTIVALWPGLDAAYHRLWRKFHFGRADLASDLLAEISVQIANLDLARVRSVAATLIRNTERNVRRAFVRQDRLARITRDIADPSIEVEAAGLQRPNRDNAADLDARLIDLPECDALLLKRVFVLGETQAQAGQALGLSPDAARKRVQRALARLDVPKNISAGMSHSVAAAGL